MANSGGPAKTKRVLAGEPRVDSSPIVLSKLESHLWEAANILRGSPVDRSDCKSYFLPLLFFKRICDVWDEEHEAMLAEYGNQNIALALLELPKLGQFPPSLFGRVEGTPVLNSAKLNARDTIQVHAPG
jgi:type I restriction-modification system DNA methylase subunit